MKALLLIFIAGLILFCLLALYAFKRLGRGWSFQLLFKDLNRKIWMTVCLGSVFFGFYLLLVLLGAYFIEFWKTDLLFFVYRHPIEFVYGGLWLFACTSLSIYLTRMIIKYFYLTRGKDN